MARRAYDGDPGASEFTGDGQFSSAGHGGMPGVGVVPPGAITSLLEWYWTNPADPASAPELNGGSIGDDAVNRVRPKN
jgi:hypothetical protein